MELYKFRGDVASITPAQFDQGQDFVSYLGDEKLVARPGGVRIVDFMCARHVVGGRTA